MADTQAYRDPRWQKLRLQVFERDGWRCTRCGRADLTLHAHHTVYGGEPWDVDPATVVTLCVECHWQHRATDPGERRIGRAKGGYARAVALSPERRTEIASNAARARWGTDD